MLRVIEYFAESLKVIRNGINRKLGYGFLFAFHSNYSSILYHFRDKARYWSKIATSYPAFNAPVRGGGSHRNNVISFSTGKKLELCGYPIMKKFEDMFSRFDRIPACDRLIDIGYYILRQHSPRCA